MSYLKLGTWNAYCDVCAKKYKANQLRLRWDGFMVCKKDWEPRQPQDFLRGIPETSNNLPWTRPVDFNGPVPQPPLSCNIITSSAVAGLGVPGCMVAGKPFNGSFV